MTASATPARIMTLAALALALVALAAPAAATAEIRFFEATAQIENGAMTVIDTTPNVTGGAFLPVRVLRDAATGEDRVIINTQGVATGSALFPAGPGCTRIANPTGPAFSCGVGAVNAFVWRIGVSSPLSPTNITLDATGSPLPVTASLGQGQDVFVLRQDAVDTVDGGADVDEIDAPFPTEVVAGRLLNAPERYSNDGRANDGFVGHVLTDNLTSFEKVRGGNNDDVLSGGGAADDIAGLPGADQISGNDGADVLNGDSGNDVIDGGNGDDRLVGDDGSAIVGSTSDDHLDGGPGNDVLIGGIGADTVIGGPGDDDFRLRDGVRDVVPCDPGANTFDLDLKDDVAKAEDCLASSVSLSSSVAKLNAAIAAGTLSANVLSAPPPLAPSFTVGAIHEGPNARVVRRVLVSHRGAAVRVALRCPARLKAPCRGTVELRDLRGRLLGRAPSHAIRPGRTATTLVRLLTAAARRPGAHAVLVRVREGGQFGAKTTGMVLPLAVLKR